MHHSMLMSHGQGVGQIRSQSQCFARRNGASAPRQILGKPLPCQVLEQTVRAIGVCFSDGYQARDTGVRNRLRKPRSAYEALAETWQRGQLAMHQENGHYLAIAFSVVEPMQHVAIDECREPKSSDARAQQGLCLLSNLPHAKYPERVSNLACVLSHSLAFQRQPAAILRFSLKTSEFDYTVSHVRQPT
jgi:hypothetical protein